MCYPCTEPWSVFECAVVLFEGRGLVLVIVIAVCCILHGLPVCVAGGAGVDAMSPDVF